MRARSSTFVSLTSAATPFRLVPATRSDAFPSEENSTRRFAAIFAAPFFVTTQV